MPPRHPISHAGVLGAPAESQHLASVLPHGFFFEQNTAKLGLRESKSHFPISCFVSREIVDFSLLVKYPPE